MFPLPPGTIWWGPHMGGGDPGGGTPGGVAGLPESEVGGSGGKAGGTLSQPVNPGGVGGYNNLILTKNNNIFMF